MNYYDPSGLARFTGVAPDSPFSVTVTATPIGVPLIEIIGQGRDRSSSEPNGFISLDLDRELRCERSSVPGLSTDDMEDFLNGVDMEADEKDELYSSPTDKKMESLMLYLPLQSPQLPLPNR